MTYYKGIALDIGTTNIAAALVRDGGYMGLQGGAPNPQALYAPDLIGRILAADRDYAALRGALLEGVNALVAGLCATAGVAPHSLPTVAVGNSLMCSFFLGLPVSAMGVSPYTPPSLFGEDYRVEGYIGGNAYIAPAFGSFVGGDISAGTLCMDEKDAVLYIDAGTNGEVYGSYGGKTLVCSAAAGSALEKGVGRGSSIAYKVARVKGKLLAQTESGRPATAIAGSGIIQLVSLMLGEECDEKGHITAGKLVLNEGLSFTEGDMTAFQLAKAAIAAATLCTVRGLGLPPGKLKKLYVAGVIGQKTAEADLIRTGLLPTWAADKVCPVGNGALKGAAMLLEEENRQKLLAICAGAKVLPLDKSEYFKERFAEELFFYE